VLVDGATLRDLSIVDAGEDGASLFARLDHARTGLGRAALRSRLRRLPPPAEARDTQAAIRYLGDRLHGVRALIDATNPDEVDAYLSLNWQAVTKHSRPGRFIERIVLRLRYRQALRQIRHGVNALRQMLAGVKEMINVAGSGPALLQRQAHALAEHSDMLRDAWRLSESRSLADMLEADRLARGPARDAIRALLSIVADLDAQYAIASATIEYQWCFPDIVDDLRVVQFRGLRHAQLPSSVPNDIVLDGTRGVLAVTGPNMAGKSTLLKSVGTAIYLAHLGCGVPAVRARLSCFDAMLAALYVRDSLANGESYYLSEVRRIKELLKSLAATPRMFALLDEPFKGTNIHDASEATALLLDGLCAKESSIVILTTHLASVVRSREGDEGLTTAHLAAQESEGGLVFDYQLRPGISDQRLGMVLLEREGVAPELVSAIQRRAGRSAHNPG